MKLRDDQGVLITKNKIYIVDNVFSINEKAELDPKWEKDLNDIINKMDIDWIIENEK